MERKQHLYSNEEDFKHHVKQRIKIDDEQFELLWSEMDEEDRFEDDQIKLLVQEDEIIQALHLCFSKSFLDCLPQKSQNQLINELSQEGLMQTEENKVAFFCKKHKGTKAVDICLNKSCKYTLFCMKCRKSHGKKCDRKEMDLNIDQIQNKDFMNGYFDVSRINYEEIVEKVRGFLNEYREQVNQMFNVFEKTLVKKVRLQSKEFRFKQIKESIEDAHSKFTGKANNRRRAIAPKNVQFGYGKSKVFVPRPNGRVQIGR